MRCLLYIVLFIHVMLYYDVAGAIVGGLVVYYFQHDFNKSSANANSNNNNTASAAAQNGNHDSSAPSSSRPNSITSGVGTNTDSSTMHSFQLDSTAAAGTNGTDVSSARQWAAALNPFGGAKSNHQQQYAPIPDHDNGGGVA